MLAVAVATRRAVSTIAFAVGSLVGCRETAAPKADADAVASASASASASADGSADADGSANADANAGANADANADASDAGTSDAGVGDSGGPARAVMHIDQAGDGKTFDVPSGGKIILFLASSPTSGFDWSVTKAPAALGTPEMGFIAGTGEGLGAGGKRRITWNVKGALPAGESAVELGYKRGFEQGTPPVKTFHFKVRPAK